MAAAGLTERLRAATWAECVAAVVHSSLACAAFVWCLGPPIQLLGAPDARPKWLVLVGTIACAIHALLSQHTEAPPEDAADAASAGADAVCDVGILLAANPTELVSVSSPLLSLMAAPPQPRGPAAPSTPAGKHHEPLWPERHALDHDSLASPHHASKLAAREIIPTMVEASGRSVIAAALDLQQGDAGADAACPASLPAWNLDSDDDSDDEPSDAHQPDSTAATAPELAAPQAPERPSTPAVPAPEPEQHIPPALAPLPLPALEQHSVPGAEQPVEDAHAALPSPPLPPWLLPAAASEPEHSSTPVDEQQQQQQQQQEEFAGDKGVDPMMQDSQEILSRVWQVRRVVRRVVPTLLPPVVLHDAPAVMLHDEPAEQPSIHAPGTPEQPPLDAWPQLDSAPSPSPPIVGHVVLALCPACGLRCDPVVFIDVHGPPEPSGLSDPAAAGDVSDLPEPFPELQLLSAPVSDADGGPVAAGDVSEVPEPFSQLRLVPAPASATDSFFAWSRAAVDAAGMPPLRLPHLQEQASGGQWAEAAVECPPEHVPAGVEQDGAAELMERVEVELAGACAEPADGAENIWSAPQHVALPPWGAEREAPRALQEVWRLPAAVWHALHSQQARVLERLRQEQEEAQAEREQQFMERLCLLPRDLVRALFVETWC